MDTPHFTTNRLSKKPACTRCDWYLGEDFGRVYRVRDNVLVQRCLMCLQDMVYFDLLYSHYVPADKSTLFLIYDIRKGEHPWSPEINVARRTPDGRVPSKRDLMEAQGHLCAICLDLIVGSQAVLDHIIPIRLGGTTSYNNLQMLCRSCNSRKKDWHPLDYACLLSME